jgi:hypothetical protein
MLSDLDHDVSSQADIWSAAMNIWALMHASLGKEKILKLQKAAAENFVFHGIGDTFPGDSSRMVGWKGWYSQPLHDLVRQCLRINPKERPGFLELRKTVKEQIDRLDSIMGDFKAAAPSASETRISSRRVRDWE